MRSSVVDARVAPRISHGLALAVAAAIATLLILTTPARARAQAEWNIGPFLDYATIHGGHPASAGLQTGVFVGPIGLRVSGFSALDQPYSSSTTTTDMPRWGGDADLMFIFDFASRGSRGVGIAPYVFAGAGLGVRNQTAQFYNASSYNSTDLEGGWSYGGGLLLPLGNTLEAMGEIRARPSGFFNVTPSTRPTYTEFRVGLSLRLGTALGGSRYRSASFAPSPPRPRRSQSDDAVHAILGSVSEAGGAPPASAARVIPTAEHYLGTPYRYGGTSPITGFDCSGFVQYVFARNAVRLPRTSRQQAKVGVALSRNWRSLRPGDLVMFAERGEPISHVAIYAGRNRIIHASASGGEVRYDDLSTRRGQWFVEHIAAARRVTPDGRGLMLDLVKMLDAKSLLDTALDIGDLAPKP
ncbi:MAG TPA: C40 family peptidase [Gemmatimonadaceae bacterium]|nr:C40 family peptidase [Gemmatimonadaceae bacterium]